MNLFSFTGNLGKDAEVKSTQGGTTICEFSVAVKSGYGEREKTNWVRCAMFGKKAEGQLPQYLTKGTQVAVSGELELQEWEGQNGKSSMLAITVQNIDLIGGKPQQQGAPMQQAPQQPEQQGYQQSQQQPQPTYQQPQQNGYAQAQNGAPSYPQQGQPQNPK